MGENNTRTVFKGCGVKLVLAAESSKVEFQKNRKKLINQEDIYFQIKINLLSMFYSNRSECIKFSCIFSVPNKATTYIIMT